MINHFALTVGGNLAPAPAVQQVARLFHGFLRAGIRPVIDARIEAQLLCVDCAVCQHAASLRHILEEAFGQIAVYSGTVSMGGMPSLGASSIVIDPKGVFQVEGTNDVNFPLSLVGGGLLNLTTTGTVTLSAPAGNFGGAITDSAGTLRVVNNAALGGTGSNVTISNGATLDVFGNNATVNKQFVVSGTGVGGLGAVINSSTTASTTFDTAS